MAVSGVLNVNKPAGWSSFRVVSLIRRRSGVRRVGHAGTLDPAATGVLLVCLGQAVRISQYLMDLSKTYRAVVTLGTATDTYDAAGRPVSHGDTGAIREAQARQALAVFLGEIEQVPPAYSALKRGGRPAYAYARAGRALALEPRRATIYRIEMLSFNPPDLTIEVECGKGTYIRTLAHDLGQRLGCGAHLRSLVRLRVGPFALGDACSVQRLEEAFRQGDWEDLPLPLDYGLGHLPAVTLDAAAETEIRHGRPLPADASALLGQTEAGQAHRCRAYAQDSTMVGVLRFEAAKGLWRPEKVFGSGPEGELQE